ncbi:MAG: SPOC like C-terminal domain-containing protein [Lentinula lateritia]|uniref:ATP-dependent DNA helicase II subunit 1 n=1 Tax=Lentinula lateritia TaxID=40482 RepID=A0ABQ8VGU9_9AGAR|nr:MAG: SPOC like C-terminal domain-containing protein [Lentinula lateritia]KAJ4489784.1 SPOC like C-terminal domain-containing protein [Lentinula lateritia]
MAPYDDWNRVDEDEEDELQDAAFFDAKKDVILFCIDCSPSMLALRPDPENETKNTSHLYAALNSAMNLQKRKVVTGPNDSFGILLFNTTRKPDTPRTQGSEIKKNMFLYQPIGPISAPTIQELIQLLNAAQEDSDEIQKQFPPCDSRVAMGDVFTSCNWVIRDGAPKTATKRVFLITDEDDPHPSSKQLKISAQTTLEDLAQAGVVVEPFFIQSEDRPFDVTKFYSSVLQTNAFADDVDSDPSILNQSISVSRIEDLLSQMKFREVAKRALFNIPFELAKGLTIGVKGYGLVTEQKKGEYKYFVDLGDRLEAATVKTGQLDEDRDVEVDKSNIVYGMAVVGAAPSNDDAEDDSMAATKVVKSGQRPFYTADEMRSFRTLGLEPGLKLLGFKPRDTLKFEDNVKHSLFLYPEENTYAGSKRTFSALLKSMIKKKVVGLARGVLRRNSTPTIYAVLPQEEDVDEMEPAGFHIIPLPFADDIRSAPIDEGYIASDDLKDKARAWINKMTIKSGYVPDSYPNPALAFHYDQLEASAFREEFNPDAFEDLTEPNVDLIHAKAGKLLKEWKVELADDHSATLVIPVTGSKRKSEDTSNDGIDVAEIKTRFESGSLMKLKVDQLKAFCRSQNLSTSGKKADLIQRVEDWCNSH